MPLPLEALLVTVRVAVLAPSEVGVQRTVTPWLEPAPTSNGVPGGETRLNWLACAPLMPMALTVSVRLPVLPMVRVESSLVFLTTLPKSSGDGLRPITRAVPVPLTVTSNGSSPPSGSLWSIRTVQERAPCTEGSKLTMKSALLCCWMVNGVAGAVRLKSPHCARPW